MKTLSRRLVGLLNFRACCCLLCLTAAPQTFGDFVGLEAEIRTDLTICQDTSQDFIDEPLTVCSLYAVFDDPIERLLSVINEGMFTTDPNGFFQHPFGAGTPYYCFFQEDIFPDLLCDSYVAIGNECNSGSDATFIDPLIPCPFNPEWPNCIGGWFNGNPANGQGDAGTYPDLRVLVAQFSMAEGDNAFGVVGLAFIGPNGIPTTIPHRIFDCRAGACLSSACPADVNGDGTVGALDLATLLGAWGPCDNGPCRCLDADEDQQIDAADLAVLLGSWGPCP